MPAHWNEVKEGDKKSEGVYDLLLFEYDSNKGSHSGTFGSCFKCLCFYYYKCKINHQLTFFKYLFEYLFYFKVTATTQYDVMTFL